MYAFWDKVKTPTGGPGYILAQESREIGKEMMYAVQLNKSDYPEEQWIVLCHTKGPNKLFYYLESELSRWTEETVPTVKEISSTGRVKIKKLTELPKQPKLHL